MIMSTHSGSFLKKTTHFLEHTAGWLAVFTAFFLPLSTSITDILFIACPILFFLTGRYVEKLQYIWQCRAVFLCVVLFSWMLFAITYTPVPLKEAFAGLFKYDKLLLGVFFMPIFREEKWRRYALHAFFLAMGVTVLAALLKAAGLVHQGEKFGPMLLFKDRIQTSFLLAMAAYFALVLFLDTATERRMRWGYVAGCVASVFLLFSIGGRSGYFIFCLLLMWLLWNRWRWRGIVSAVGIVGLLLAAAYLFSPAFNARLQESIHDMRVYQAGQNNTSLGLRTEFAKNSVQLIKAHPIFGSGTGSFAAQYASLGLPSYMETRNPHNQYMHVFVQWGVVGFTLLLWLFYAQWRDSRFLSPSSRLIAQGVLLAIMVGSLANSWLLDTTEGHFYVYFMALLFAGRVGCTGKLQQA